MYFKDTIKRNISILILNDFPWCFFQLIFVLLSQIHNYCFNFLIIISTRYIFLLLDLDRYFCNEKKKKPLIQQWNTETPLNIGNDCVYFYHTPSLARKHKPVLIRWGKKSGISDILRTLFKIGIKICSLLVIPRYSS